MFKLHTIFSPFFHIILQFFPGKYTIRLTCMGNDSEKKMIMDPCGSISR